MASVFHSWAFTNALLCGRQAIEIAKTQPEQWVAQTFVEDNEVPHVIIAIQSIDVGGHHAVGGKAAEHRNKFGVVER